MRLDNKNAYPDLFTGPDYWKFILGVNFIDLPTDPSPSTNWLYTIGGVLYYDGAPVIVGPGAIWELEGGTGPNIYYNAGNVGIGLNAPSYPLEVDGDAKFNDDLIISNNENIYLQDTLGGLTSFINRDINDHLFISNTTIDKNIYLNTSGTGYVELSKLIANSSISILESGGGTDFITITADAVAANRAYTIPDILEDGEFVVSPNSVKHDGDAPIWNGTSWVNRPMAQYGGFTTYVSPTINGDGTITVGDQTAILWDNATFQGSAAHYHITGGTTGVAGFPSIPDGVVSYLVADYNGGSPEFQITTTLSDIEQSDTAPYCTLFRTGNLVLTLNWDEMANGLANKLCHRFVKTERFQRESGLMLSEGAGNTFLISAGTVWYGVTQDTFLDWDSSVDVCRFWYHSSGSWTYSNETTYNNTHYDDGTDLVALSGNKYTVNWIYKGLADQTNIGGYVLGSQEYPNVAQARLATSPQDLPEAIRSFGILVGRIIVLNGVTGATAVESAFEVRLNPSSVYSHSDLADLTNDDHHQYALLDGRSGGQVLIGGTDASDDLTLQTTSNATKGSYFLSDLTTNGFVKTQGGTGELIVDTSAYENPLIFSTGLTRSVDTITSNLSTGIAGGQSVIGGLNAGDDLTLSSTSNATKGSILFGTSAYDEVNNRLGIGISAPDNPLHVVGDAQITGDLLLEEDGAGTDLLTITAAALGAARTYTIPDAGAAANFIVSTSSPVQGDILYHNGTTWVSLVAGTDGYFLKTQGVAANPIWADVIAGGTPGGADTQIQYNDSGVFGGDANLTWDVLTSEMRVDGDVILTSGSKLILNGVSLWLG